MDVFTTNRTTSFRATYSCPISDRCTSRTRMGKVWWKTRAAGSANNIFSFVPRLFPPLIFVLTVIYLNVNRDRVRWVRVVNVGNVRSHASFVQAPYVLQCAQKYCRFGKRQFIFHPAFPLKSRKQVNAYSCARSKNRYAVCRVGCWKYESNASVF